MITTPARCKALFTCMICRVTSPHLMNRTHHVRNYRWGTIPCSDELPRVSFLSGGLESHLYLIRSPDTLSIGRRRTGRSRTGTPLSSSSPLLLSLAILQFEVTIKNAIMITLHVSENSLSHSAKSHQYNPLTTLDPTAPTERGHLYQHQH
jgi:hypothetical protein